MNDNDTVQEEVTDHHHPWHCSLPLQCGGSTLLLLRVCRLLPGLDQAEERRWQVSLPV